MLLDKKQWLGCSWADSRPGAAQACPSDGVRGALRLEGGSLRLGADTRGRASLENGTLYGAVEVPDAPFRREELCEQSKFRLVLCESAPAAQTGGRPRACGADVITGACGAEVKTGTCENYHRTKTWCSKHHSALKNFQIVSSVGLLVLVLAAMRQVHQDISRCSAPEGDQGIASASSGLSGSFHNALERQEGSDDTQEKLRPLLDSALKLHAADSLRVHAVLCSACVTNALFGILHDYYDSIWHYVVEGSYNLGIALLAITVVSIYICKQSDAAAGLESHASVVKYRWHLSWYCTVFFVVRAIAKYHMEVHVTADQTYQTLYEASEYLLALPLVLVLVYVSAWATRKTVKRARTKAQRTVSTLDTSLLTRLQDGRNAERSVEESQDGAGGNDVSEVDESANASFRSEWMHKSATRYYRCAGVVIIEVVILFMAWVLQKTVDGSFQEQDYGCIGCRCDFDRDDLYLYRYAGAAADEQPCMSYLEDSVKLRRWEKVAGAESPIGFFNVLELVKIFVAIIQIAIYATVFVIMVLERIREIARQELFAEREAAGTTAMKAGDGVEADLAYQRCCELLSGSKEKNYVMCLLDRSRSLRDRKAEGDEHSLNGNYEQAALAYTSALAAAPQCESVAGLLAQAEAALQHQQHQQATERLGKEAIMHAEPADVELPVWVLKQGQPTVDAAQTLLARLQMALNAENLRRGDPDRWKIQSCMAVSIQDGASSNEAVVLCQDTKLNSVFTAKALFAPKCWAPDWQTTWISFDAATQQHLSQQADRLRSLNHDRVARLVEDSFLAFDTVFFCKFDLLEGETLSELFAREQGCMLEHEAIKLATDVLSGLDAIHKLELFHSCVAPQHLVHVSGTWKLQTWSVLRMPSDSPGLSPNQQRACHYLAPEQVSRMLATADGNHDPRSDLYSVGVVMYRALAGRLPIAAGETDIMKIINAVRYKPAQDLRDVTQAGTVTHQVAKLVSQALQKDSFDRYESAESMQRALTEALLQSPGARYDIFISYRVRTEKEFASALHKELSRKTLGLHGERARVYLDSAELRDGKRWDDGFVDGLTRSAVFVPLVSEGSAMPLSQLDGIGEAPGVDNVLLEWGLALQLEELGIVQSILPVLVGKASDTGDGTRPQDYFSQELEWGGRDSYADVPHTATAAKEQHYMKWWEEQVVTQVATQNDGVLYQQEILELSTKLGGSLTAVQIRSAFGEGTAIDGAAFLQWWRSDGNQGGVASRHAPRSVRQIVNGIKSFQGIGCHSLRRNDADSQGELLGGEALVQEVAKRVLQVASESLLSSATTESLRTRS